MTQVLALILIVIGFVLWIVDDHVFLAQATTRVHTCVHALTHAHART